MRITAELQATGGNTTGFPIPDEVVGDLGGGGRPKVVVTVNGYEYQSSIAKMGGAYWLGVSAERRTAAGVKAGDVVELDIVLDTRERTVDVPEDLALALAAEPEAKERWDKLSYSNQRQHAESVTGAKAAETRARRVAKAIEKLLAG
ncbi:YdeI/OmpD-associated family protein [Actinoplanes sp. NBRC 103695]|uniref:YdeI/OmpD-associated family protein n=1 Tax=Actinoplanes sp. NBRC 103695 TaxID=3032202 RepID=UPI0024A12814|nr:YdeI/OmpD-associated family protein [Actinoplanes sp. NBRC 103695]GLY94944.1 hypothetical protein Acsp02_21990 [Actinoplanes sp. NBRC 103695]